MTGVRRRKLDYAVNRFYNAGQGRFTQVDPIGMSAASLNDPQSLNLYTYCGNDPINRIDPDGLFSWKKLFGWVGKIFKAIAIAVFVAGAILLTAGLVVAAFAGWAASAPFFGAFSALMGFFQSHQIIASILGIGSAGAILTPKTFGGSVSGVSSYLSGDVEDDGGIFIRIETWVPSLTAISNFAAGLGDDLSFGLTRRIRQQMGTDEVVDKCSGAYSAGGWTGVGVGLVGGAARGGIKGLIKVKRGPMEWSHWIPDRYKNISGWIRDSGLNGNYRTIAEHALNDPFRYRWMPKVWKASNSINPAWLRQLDRVPDWLKFGGAAAGSKAANSSNCN